MAELPILVHLDGPKEIPLTLSAPVKGWVASSFPIESVRIGQTALVLEERLDVRRAKPEYPHVWGFRGDVSEFPEDKFRLTCQLSGAPPFVWEKALPRPLPSPNKAGRLQRIRPHLRTDLPFTETAFHFDFLTPELRSRFMVGSGTDELTHGYGPSARELIDRYRDGLVLDAGAGFRNEDYPNVITLEIAPFTSTDVLGVNEQLPFKDETFDAVISCAVLEHLRDPFAAARELVRVTKRGGSIYADVPFLQPYHGFPSHYYNMTSQGLVNLFSDSCEIARTAVPEYGLPIWSLNWFLRDYLAGLPPETRESFRQMRVGELLARTEQYLPQDFVRKLSPEKNFELACVTSVWAVKK